MYGSLRNVLKNSSVHQNSSKSTEISIRNESDYRLTNRPSDRPSERLSNRPSDRPTCTWLTKNKETQPIFSCVGSDVCVWIALVLNVFWVHVRTSSSATFLSTKGKSLNAWSSPKHKPFCFCISYLDVALLLKSVEPGYKCA